MAHERDNADDQTMFVDCHAHINNTFIPVLVWTMDVNGIPS